MGDSVLDNSEIFHIFHSVVQTNRSSCIKEHISTGCLEGWKISLSSIQYELKKQIYFTEEKKKKGKKNHFS